MPPEEIVHHRAASVQRRAGELLGPNFFKSHTEYLGALVVMLAVIGVGDRGRRRLVRALGAIAVLFLLVAFGGHTPFYRLWYEVMPMMKKVRAPGMAFFLVALPVRGVRRVRCRSAAPARGLAARRSRFPLGVLGGLALLGVVGVLQAVATVLAGPEQAARVTANAAALQAGALRLLLVVLAGGGVLWAVWQGRLRSRRRGGPRPGR